MGRSQNVVNDGAQGTLTIGLQNAHGRSAEDAVSAQRTAGCRAARLLSPVVGRRISQSAWFWFEQSCICATQCNAALSLHAALAFMGYQQCSTLCRPKQGKKREV